MDVTLRTTPRRTIRGILLTGLLLGAAGLACSQEIVVTLLPKGTEVWEYEGAKASKVSGASLRITDANFTGGSTTKQKKTASWLDFPITALPAGITINQERLVLAREYQAGTADRGMTINVVPVDKVEPDKLPAPDIGVAGTIQSDPETRTKVNEYLHLSDAASLKETKGETKLTGKSGHILLLLQPTSSASQRIYYGLNPAKPGLQPRLIVTYSYNTAAKKPGCTSEPAALAGIQSDGRLADSSSCPFVSPADNPTREKYFPLMVAGETLTKKPAVYGDMLYVVQKRKGVFFLDALKPLGQPVPEWKPLPVPGEILVGTPMVVDRFGRLRIVTQSRILTCRLDDKEPKIIETAFPFGSAPAAVVPGPDGSLYVVAVSPASKFPSIISLNPDLQELWEVTVDPSASSAITLGPDGRFVYALAKVGNETKFLAINAQTGQQVEIPKFPSNLNTLRNPVAVHLENGMDFIAVAGEEGNKGMLWITRNVPKSTNADSLATLTKRWEYPGAEGGIGQPIPCSVRPDPKILSTFRLCFVAIGGSGTKMTSIPFDADGTAALVERPLSPVTGTDASPVVDSAGNVVFWAKNALYGFNNESNALFAPTTPDPALLSDSQLLFGPGGTLYAVNRSGDFVSVSALIPALTLSADSKPSISSPTQLRVTGVAAKRPDGQAWTLTAGGSVILGNGFEVLNGAVLDVKVGASQ